MSEAGKITIYGWVGSYNDMGVCRESSRTEITVENEKGTQDEWHEDDWPPVKVRVTVEEITE